jgi:ABC-type amino acid transport substrate-binding protein
MIRTCLNKVDRIGCLALVVIPAVCLAGCASTDSAWERVRGNGVLRVGMDAGFPPFEFVSADGALAGFDVELAEELGRRLGVDVEFVANLPYDGLYDALAVARVDVVVSALVINPARTTDYGFSTAYFDAGQVVVVREGLTTVEGVDDLEGKTIAVEFGTRGDLQARRWALRLPGVDIVPHETAAAAVEAVAGGEADVALVDHVSALAATGEGSGLVVASDPLVGEPYAVATCRDSRRLLRAINEALAEMESDGTLGALVEKWLVGEG